MSDEIYEQTKNEPHKSIEENIKEIHDLVAVENYNKALDDVKANLNCEISIEWLKNSIGYAAANNIHAMVNNIIERMRK